MGRNPCLDSVLEELAAAGIHCPQVARGAKAYQIRWKSPAGQLRVTGAAFTPSDVNAPHQARREVRAILKADGMIGRPEPRAPARQLSRLELLERRLARIEAHLERLGIASPIQNAG